MERPSQRWLAREDRVPLAAPPPPEAGPHPPQGVREQPPGRGLRQRVRLHPEGRATRSVLLLPRNDYMVQFGV